MPPAKKYDKIYPHIASEVLHGSSCSKQIDVYSLGTVLRKIGSRKRISTVSNIATKCMSNNPQERITLTGTMTTLSTQNEFPLKVKIQPRTVYRNCKPRPRKHRVFHVTFIYVIIKKTLNNDPLSVYTN